MTHHDPTRNLFSCASSKDFARLTIQTERVRCHRCHEITVVAVKPEYIDWQKVAEEYRTQLQRLVNEHSQMMDEMELIYGPDNPAANYYRNKWRMLWLEVQTHFGGPPQGTSGNF